MDREVFDKVLDEVLEKYGLIIGPRTREAVWETSLKIIEK